MPRRRDRKDYMKAWNAKNKARRRIHDVKFKYGLNEEDYQKLYRNQFGLCAICEVRFEDTPHVDHDHHTGKVRGLLYKQCNLGLGRFQDSIDLLEAAHRYLR